MKTTNLIHFMRFALLTLTLLLAAGLTPARASVVVVAPTVSTTGSFTFTQDITFTLTSTVASGSGLLFAFDEWVTSDGTQNEIFYLPNLSISINGGAPQTFGAGNFADNQAFTFGAVTPNDGYFFLSNGPALAVGDTVTLRAATYTIGMTSNFNPLATQTFTGNMFMTDANTRTRISNTVAVPEPSTWAMMTLGIPVLLGCRRVRRRSAKSI